MSLRSELCCESDVESRLQRERCGDHREQHSADGCPGARRLAPRKHLATRRRKPADEVRTADRDADERSQDSEPKENATRPTSRHRGVTVSRDADTLDALS
jgi:hypothetical protein